MILTVTPNPSIDLLFSGDTFVWDDANRVESPRRRAGGQGINLTRAARVLGGESATLCFLGGRTGAELRALLDEDGIITIVVPVSGETRVFVAAREARTGRSLLLNSRGPILNESDEHRLLEQVAAACDQHKPRWLVCSGSIPRGLNIELYARIATIAHERSIRFVADCDGAALEHAVRAGCDLLAPNQHEASRLIGKPVDSVAAALEAVRALQSVAPRVLIKLGEQGAVLAQDGSCWHAVGRNIKEGSAVGAGDAFLGAFLVAEMAGESPERALCCAVAAGSAVLLSANTDLLCRSDYDQMLADVRVTAG